MISKRFPTEDEAKPVMSMLPTRWIRSFCAAPLRNVAGNTLAIVAFAMIPLTGMMGSAVDMGRSYTAKVRLQQACDAGALAGRRIMEGDVFNAGVEAEARKFFNFNFPAASFQVASFTPTVTHPDVGVIGMEAKTAVPTTIMKLFGYERLPISVSCTASQNFVNTDIVLVLDVTGSMAWRPNGGDCTGSCASSGGSRIAGLRKAVLALYDELKPMQDQLESAGMRLRYGVVPFSSTVNVGKLIYARDPKFIRDPAKYRYERCDSRGQNCSYPSHTENHSDAWFRAWASDANTQLGCIEERDTAYIAPSATYAPDNAYDLDINREPFSEGTRWPPYDPDEQRVSRSTACPYPARRLADWTRNDLSDYVDDLTPVGATYHDIGMIWGGRLISSAGIFGDSPTTYKNLPVNRYVIFMTDGQMDPSMTAYSAYGIERYDARISGSTATSETRLGNLHDTRFSIACDRVKETGARIIVVGFATSLDTRRQNCASDGMAQNATDNQALIDVFKDIGKKIGALRLTQ